jgi:transmembrane sensor
MKEQVTERILHAYFANKATHHEKQLIKEWLRIAGNEEIFYQHLARWEAQHLQFQPDEEKASQSYKAFLRGEKQSVQITTISENTRRIPFSFQKRILAVAASVVLLISAALYLYSDHLFYNIYATSYGMTQNILLDDGSEVTLNANSTLKVPRNLSEDKVREVWLDGEAFFSVTKRPDKVRFMVHTENISVEVLGTKFNVNNRRGATEVVLDEGSVKLTSSEADQISPVIMKPGDYVVLHKTDTSFKKMAVKPEKYTAWQANKLIFEDTPLREVAEKIEDYYGVKIRIDNKQLGSRQVTGTLPNNDLGVVLKSLSMSHDLEIVRQTDYIIFR